MAEKERQEAISRAERYHLARFDTLPCKLVFGMSEKEVHTQLRKLYDKGVLKERNNEYVFPFSGEYHKYIATLSTEFYNDSLYNLMLMVNNDDWGTIVDLRMLLARKYGSFGFELKYREMPYYEIYAGYRLHISLFEAIYEDYRIIFEDRFMAERAAATERLQEKQERQESMEYF